MRKTQALHAQLGHCVLSRLSPPSPWMVLYMSSKPESPNCFCKCIRTANNLPVVYTTHKGRRQLPSESTNQTHISTAGSALRLEPAAVIERFRSAKVRRAMIFYFMWKYVISAWQNIYECLSATVFIERSRDVIALDVCMLTELSVCYQRVFSGHGGLYFFYVTLPHDWHVSASCHSATIWHI